MMHTRFRHNILCFTLPWNGYWNPLNTIKCYEKFWCSLKFSRNLRPYDLWHLMKITGIMFMTYDIPYDFWLMRYVQVWFLILRYRVYKVFHTQTYTSDDLTWPLTSIWNHGAYVAHLHTKFQIHPIFPSWDIGFTAFPHFYPMVVSNDLRPPPKFNSVWYIHIKIWDICQRLSSCDIIYCLQSFHILTSNDL